jgi:hypothetical protein
MVGNPPQSELSDTEISNAIIRSDDMVNTLTNPAGDLWTSGSTGYSTIQTLSELRAAIIILMRYKDMDGKRKELEAEFWKLYEEFDKRQAHDKFGVTARTEQTDQFGVGGYSYSPIYQE